MAFTEFYCDAATGDNLNAGTGGTNDYTTAGGNWNGTTRVFTVTDGTNPSTKIAVDDFCSVYVTSGATVATYVARVTVVQNANNGTVTFSTSAFMGAVPSNGTGTMTLKHGGFWKGPNAGVAFPLDRAGVGAANNTSNNPVRINFKNTQSYSISSGISVSGLTGVTIQGYSSTAGDGGKATIDGSTNAITLLTDSSNYDVWADLILSSSATSGAVNNFVLAGAAQRAIRVVSHGARVSGIATTGGSTAGATTLIECETYGNNTSNTANRGGIDVFSGGQVNLLRCFSHDNTGSNNNGATAGPSAAFVQCIFSGNGKHGVLQTGSNANIIFVYENCDFYNNGGDGINIGGATTNACFVWVENSNFIKNTGQGINNTVTSNLMSGLVLNCGYGSGTQANGGGDATLGALVESGKITYASGVTPYSAPTTGNFTINLAAARNAGRGRWEENDGTNTGTIGYPDIGAAQHYDTQKASTFGG